MMGAGHHRGENGQILVDYISMLRRSWGLIVAAAALGALLGFVASRVITPEYQAQAAVSVNVYSVGSISGADSPQQRMNAFSKVATSAAVLREAAAASDTGLSASDLEDVVTAQVPPDTTTLLVTAKAADPQAAARIANSTATAAAQRISTEGTQEFIIEGKGKSKDSRAKVLVDARIVAEAVPPTEPVSPRTSMLVALGLILGLLVGAAIALRRQSTRPVINGEDDLQRLLAGAAPVLGSVRGRDLPDSATGAKPMPAGVSDQLQLLRTALLAQNGLQTPACVVVTGTAPHSAGLAMALASTFSTQEQTAGTAENGPGVPPAQFVSAQRQRFDWAFVDAGSPADSAYPILVAAVADGVVMTVEAGRTTVPDFHSGLTRLQRSGARILGVVTIN